MFLNSSMTTSASEACNENIEKTALQKMMTSHYKNLHLQWVTIQQVTRNARDLHSYLYNTSTILSR